MGNDDRPKKSWRDIDKRRDGSNSGSRSGSAESRLNQSSPEDARQKQYRAALEAAFAKGELGKLADKLNISGLGPSVPTPTPAPAPLAAVVPPGSESPSEAGSSSDGAAAAGSGAGLDSPANARKIVGRKKGEDEKTLLRRKLVEAASRSEISRAAEKYLARYPLPDDHELLEQLLDHDNESRVREAIARICDLIGRRQPPRRSRALCGKLRYIVETTADNDLRQAAQDLLGRLG